MLDLQSARKWTSPAAESEYDSLRRNIAIWTASYASGGAAPGAPSGHSSEMMKVAAARARMRELVRDYGDTG